MQSAESHVDLILDVNTKETGLRQLWKKNDLFPIFTFVLSQIDHGNPSTVTTLGTLHPTFSTFEVFNMIPNDQSTPEITETLVRRPTSNRDRLRFGFRQIKRPTTAC